MSDQLTDAPIEDVAPLAGAEPVAAPEPKVETKPEPVVNEPKDPTGLRDQIKSAIAKANNDAAQREKVKAEPQTQPTGERPRGPDGKFLPQQAALEKVEQPKLDPKAPQGAPPVAEPQKLAAPGTWKAEAKSAWAQVPDHAKAEILRRESESAREIGKFQQQIQQINQQYGPIEQVLGPRRAALVASFGSVDAAVKRLFDLSDVSTQDPNAFLAYYLSQPEIASRVDMQKVLGQPTPGGDITSHPVVKQLQETVSGLRQQVSGFFNQHQAQTQQSIEREIVDFAQAVDESGNFARPHFDAVREQIFNSIPAIKAANPSLTTTQIMQKAYDIAVAAHPEISEQVRQAEKEKLRAAWEKEERAKRAQLANKSIQNTGTPAGAVPAGPTTTDLRAQLLANMRAYNQGTQPRI